jgi:hypothetical protein
MKTVAITARVTATTTLGLIESSLHTTLRGPTVTATIL